MNSTLLLVLVVALFVAALAGYASFQRRYGHYRRNERDRDS